jgi:hypothetical protein
MMTVGRLMTLLEANADAPVAWGSFDPRLDAAAGTLPSDRSLLLSAVGHRNRDQVLVLWREGDRPVYIRSWLLLHNGGVVLYLDVAESAEAPPAASSQFYIYPVDDGRVRVSPALPADVSWYGVIEVGTPTTAPDGPLTPGQCVAWIDGLCRRGIPVELRTGPA